jgi:hypothetical protein
MEVACHLNKLICYLLIGVAREEKLKKLPRDLILISQDINSTNFKIVEKEALNLTRRR